MKLQPPKWQYGPEAEKAKQGAQLLMKKEALTIYPKQEKATK